MIKAGGAPELCTRRLTLTSGVDREKERDRKTKRDGEGERGWPV